LELAIVGYQFPEVEHDPWESNALLVSLRLVSPAGTWEVVDPCLTTWEARRLAAWLASVAVREPWAGPTSLAEPNVELTAEPDGHDQGRVRVRGRFLLEERPPWSPATGGGRLSLDLDVARADLARSAMALAVSLADYPLRADDPTM
jgi:hypothetical protein